MNKLEMLASYIAALLFYTFILLIIFADNVDRRLRPKRYNEIPSIEEIMLR